MPVRILHLSDLHLGRRETPEPGAALLAHAEAQPPDLVVATGDLSHRGKRAELERAASYLRSLGAPLLAVPGNHDIPYTLPARLSSTFAEWEHVFGTIAPIHMSETLVAVGLNSVRPWRQQGGALRAVDLEAAAARLREGPDRAFRFVALHHHLASPPWRAGRKRPVRNRDDVLRSLAGAGAELVLGGHVHQATVAARHEFEVFEAEQHASLVLATAPGFGRPRPRRRGEASGFNVYEVNDEQLTVVTHAWNGTSFREGGRRSFRRG